MTHPSFILDLNRFHLAGPPKWWLDQLKTFDPSLVVVPSRQSCVYRMAQKRKLSLISKMTDDILFKDSDTRMLAGYGLVPVTSILATANWSNPFLFEELRRRAPWRLGGAEKVNAMLDDQDKKDEIDKKAKTDEHLTYLAKDGWKFYNQKRGVRSNVYIPVVKNPTPVSPKPRITLS